MAGPGGSGRLLPALGGVVFCLAVAFRRRWPLAGMLVILAALTVKTVLGSAPGRLQGTVGLLPALLLLSYGMGAFAPPRRSLWVLGLAVAVSSANLLTTPGRRLRLCPFRRYSSACCRGRWGGWCARAARASAPIANGPSGSTRSGSCTPATAAYRRAGADRARDSTT